MLASLLLASLAVLLGASQGAATPDLSSHFTGLDATFVLLDGATGAYTRHDPARAARRFPPCSTFKVPHTAMLLESGIVPSPTGGALPYDPALHQPAQWARDFDLTGAFKASALGTCSIQDHAVPSGPPDVSIHHTPYTRPAIADRAPRIMPRGLVTTRLPGHSPVCEERAGSNRLTANGVAEASPHHSKAPWEIHGIRPLCAARRHRDDCEGGGWLTR